VLTRLGLAILWLLHWLPLRILGALGRALGVLAYGAARGRRRVALVNLEACFPQWDEAERHRVVRQHFQALARSALELGILWWGSKERIQRIVRIEGIEHWDAARSRPVIVLVPHFVGLDFGATRLTTEWAGCSMYRRQSNPVMDRMLLHGRSRFVAQRLFARKDGIRPVVRAMREGLPFYYLPDQDFGPRDSIFVPFFGVPAATITGVSRIARVAGATVVPGVTRQLPGAGGYVITFYPAWTDYPSDDEAADTRRVNEFIEQRVLEMPEQYLWVHKRFKTRPPGAPPLYE
jgi:KDO2-lipid IV(A) lauroyltransferase